MAGYADKREQNYEIKYLRKVLGQVDDRIQVPKSLDAQSLLPLLDGIEPSGYETPNRRPRRVRLQSWVAYAAAFALIVALFYSMELYRPEMVESGMLVPESTQTQSAPASEFTAEDSGGAQQNDALILVGDGSGEPAGEAAPEPFAEPRTGERAEAAPAAAAYGIGGVESRLLLEQDDTAYYCRANDFTDPDRQAPVTLEIVDIASQEFVAHLDIPEMEDIDRCFVFENRLFVVGRSGGVVVVSSYDNTDPANPARIDLMTQPGELVDARAYNGVVHTVLLSGERDNAVMLPHASSEDCFMIIAYNTETDEWYTKSFIGAKDVVLLDEQEARVRYEGRNDAGEPESHTARILLHGMDIELAAES